MAVRKRTPAKRKTTTARKKPARFKSDANTQTGARPVASGAPQKGTRGARSTTTTTTRKRRTVKKATPKKTVAKKTTAKKTTTKTIKPKGRLSGLLVGGATLIGGLSALRNKPKTFGEAFKKARKDKGPNATFTYKGKKYSTVTKDQIKKAGYSNLRDYLNAQKKKK
jgi:hypothetical protein